MRNILIFPDGGKLHFMYPEDRELKIGEELQGQMKDESIVVFKIADIQTHAKEVHYILKY